MKAGIFFTGTGPILVLTTYSAFDDPHFVNLLAHKGIEKFIVCEVDIELVKKRYGQKFVAIMNDVKQSDDLRVLDYNGHKVFNLFSLKDELGRPTVHE